MYEAITVIKILIQVLLQQIAKWYKVTMYYYSLPLGKNETTYYSKNCMCYLESIAEFIKVIFIHRTPN